MINVVKKAAASAAIAILTATAWAQSPITVTVNGQPVSFENAQPQEVNGRVMVPLRGVFETMGAYVHWDQANQTVRAERGRRVVQLQIGSNAATVDGRQVYLDVPPELISDTTMVPLRFISESLGASVDWIDTRQLVAIRIAGGNEHFGPSNRTTYRTQVQRTRYGMRVFHINEVLPFRLDEALGSNGNNPGDSFSATLDTYGQTSYAGLPAGTKLMGHVVAVHPREGNEPGVLQLGFDQLQMPNGQTIPIHGRLIGLDSNSVSRDRAGVLVARSGASSNNTMAYIGFGAGAGAAIGIVSKGRVLTDAAIGGALGYLMHQIQRHPERAQNVYLAAGTPMGVRLTEQLDVR